MTRKLLNAALGFCQGILTIPFVIVVWPFFAAWFMWNETEENEKENS